MPASGDVGIAFALVIGAGLCTTLGACAAFFGKLAEPRVLAIGLGISSGVMLYVSFVEIFMSKGVPALASEWSEDAAYRNATFMFFGGMAITSLLDKLVHVIMHRIEGTDLQSDAETKADLADKDVEAQLPSVGQQAVISSSCFKCVRPGPKAVPDEPDDDIIDETEAPVQIADAAPPSLPPAAANQVDDYLSNDHHRFALKRMGLMTALAIAIHNLPEGMATFVAALTDPLNGVAIAIAIALHNIPEGVCVAMPVYYATGSRWKGFLWAFLSGLSEPVGGLLAYFVLYGSRMSDLAYGILFNIVAGMMTYISIKELIPTALKYDPHDRVVSTSVIGGMVIMAASLLMFTI